MSLKLIWDLKLFKIEVQVSFFQWLLYMPSIDIWALKLLFHIEDLKEFYPQIFHNFKNILILFEWYLRQSWSRTKHAGEISNNYYQFSFAQ